MIFLVADETLVAAKPAPRCAECRKLLRAGEVVVTFTQGVEVYVHPRLFVHRRHFDAVLAEAPVDSAVVDGQIAAVLAEARVAGCSAVEALLDA